MNNDEPEKPFKDSEFSEDNDQHSGGSREDMELPDYVDEDAVPSNDGRKWYANLRNWKYITLGLVILIVLILIPALYRTMKGWRAGMIINESSFAFAVGDDEHALSLMKQALALSPGSEPVQHAVELYNARVGDTASLQKLLERMRSGSSDSEELLGISELESRQGQWDVIYESVAKLPPTLNSSQRLRLTLIRALLKRREEGIDAAALFCLTSAQSMGGQASARLRNQAALYLLSEDNGAATRRAEEILLGVIKEKSKASLASARLLARLSHQNQAIEGGGLSTSELLEVARLLPTLPGHQWGDVLLAADVEIRAIPSSQESVVKQVIDASLRAPRQELLELARWLNSKGLYDRVVLLAGKDNPNNDTDWMLIVLDAESALQHWPEVEKMLSSPAGAGIPEAVRHLYLARVAIMTGNSAAAQEEWRSVNGSLQREKSETLNYIAGYEERIGAFDRAARTYRTMADRKESQISGLLGLIRSQPVSAPVSVMIPLYEELVVAAPQFREAMGDLAYLKLLKQEDVEASLAISKKLLASQPDSLARISAVGLGYLRNGNPKAAFDLYQGKQIEWPGAPEPWKAVRIAVLRASGETAAADTLSASVTPDRLRPEERKLLGGQSPLKSGSKPK